jgi:hypothetical protein
MGRACSTNGGEDCIWDIGGKARKTEITERPRYRSVDNIKMDLREIGWDGMDWISLAEDRDKWEGSCEHGNEPLDSIKC